MFIIKNTEFYFQILFYLRNAKLKIVMKTKLNRNIEFDF